MNFMERKRRDLVNYEEDDAVQKAASKATVTSGTSSLSKVSGASSLRSARSRELLSDFERNHERIMLRKSRKNILIVFPNVFINSLRSDDTFRT